MLTRAQVEARIAQLATMRTAHEARVSDLYTLLLKENRTLTADESAAALEARSEVGKIDEETADLRRRLEDMTAAEAAEGRSTIADVAADETRTAAANEARATGGAVVKRQPLTYERWDLRSSYFLDLVAAEKSLGRIDPEEARGRLMRHAKEMEVAGPEMEAKRWGGGDGYERRDLSRADGSGGYFVPPAWLMSEYVNLARAGRVTADLCHKLPLPPGTDSINVPKVSTGTATAIQTADNAAVQKTDLADTSLQANVKTIAGQQDIALQAIEQSPLAFDQIIFADLAGALATNVGTQVISGSNASGQVKGIRQIASIPTTAFTTGSPTLALLYPKLASAWQTVGTTRFAEPEAIVMHPRRWAWIMAALDTSNRPFISWTPGASHTAMATINADVAQGYVGTTPFGPVYVDPNIPTTVGGGTEDIILFLRPSELYLWEGPLRTRVLTEVLSNTLEVRLQLYEYLAFMPDRRIENTCMISGTGLAAPTF